MRGSAFEWRYFAGATAALDWCFFFFAIGVRAGGTAGAASLGSLSTAFSGVRLPGVTGPTLLQSSFA
jgi:hypothetical protein